MLDRLYPLFGPLLRRLEPERAHRLGLAALNGVYRLRVSSRKDSRPDERVSLMGLEFPSRVGVAAGLDKNGRYLDALSSLGFGFVEIGTVTPRAQPGQRPPRLLRLEDAGALINRMGFPNDGAAVVARRLARRTFAGVCGVNIGKNADTPLERAVDDYVACFRAVAPVADYIVVNVSSPNTPGLRRMQAAEALENVLAAVLTERDTYAGRDRRIPILVKVSPDLATQELASLATLAVDLRLDGIVATNTTLDRPGIATSAYSSIEGGLSGRPLLPFSLRTIERLRVAAGPAMTIVGVGGIAEGGDAVAMMRAGADLVQLYTGLIYRGPALVDEVRSALAAVSASATRRAGQQ
jgi:dihydroorotate dehydrogenase